jgi:hypothetical protein
MMQIIRGALLLSLGYFLLVSCALAGDDLMDDRAEKKEFVILLHGMGRGPKSMQKLEKKLGEQGYLVLNQKYPSTQKEIEELVEEFVALQVESCLDDGAERIHFVTHSLGGILLRAYLQDHQLPEGSRVVMLSPPNKGSEVTDALKEWPVYRWLMGPAGQVLGTETHSLPNQLKKIDIEVGVIVGNKSIEPWFSRLIPGEDDGKVSVESARLDEMKDFLVVEESHPFIMRKKVVIDQVLAFLKNGFFER